METVDIPFTSLGLGFLLLLIPLGISLRFRLGIIRGLLISMARMTGQLLFIGLFLVYIFELNNPWLNLLWLLAMILFATFSIIRNSELKFSILLLPSFISVGISLFSVLFYFNRFIIGLENIFDAKYLIAVGGMLLGNTLKGNIITLSSFYRGLKSKENRYLQYLGFGATRIEALLPFIQESVKLSLSPMIATMATMGLVSLPGMMTGQILGGSSPMVSVKYQIAIMVAIFSSASISSLLVILLSLTRGFTSRGMLRKDIFR